MTASREKAGGAGHVDGGGKNTVGGGQVQVPSLPIPDLPSGRERGCAPLGQCRRARGDSWLSQALHSQLPA